MLEKVHRYIVMFQMVCILYMLPYLQHNLSPKIFWKDKPIIIKQMKKWNLEKLEKAKSYIIEAEIKMKTKLNNYNNIIVKNLLVRLYSLANSIS